MITISHIQWSKNKELCELMLALDDQPGVPESHLEHAQESSSEISAHATLSSTQQLWFKRVCY